jgi:hypothetical protein
MGRSSASTKLITDFDDEITKKAKSPEFILQEVADIQKPEGNLTAR